MRLAAIVLAALIALGGCVSRAGSPSETSGNTETIEPGVTDGECGYTADPGQDSPVGLPPDDGAVDAESVVLTTSHGELTVELDAEATPCTVESFVFLADEGFYDDTDCHRLTASTGLSVLQCGDPDGDGTGGPGYTIPDELPTDLPSGPAASDGSLTVIYERGIVAMANAGPNTGGSQFFVVYRDSTLPPNYTVFGTLDATGLATVDKIAAGGIEPSDRGPEDGAPRLPVTIESAAVR